MIVIRIWEGLDNQLFQYAFARNLVTKGYEGLLDVGKSYNDPFKKYTYNYERENVIENYNISIPTIDVVKRSGFEYLKNENFGKKICCALAKRGLWKNKFIDSNSIPIYEQSYLLGELPVVKSNYLDAALLCIKCSNNRIGYLSLDSAINRYYADIWSKLFDINPNWN